MEIKMGRKKCFLTTLYRSLAPENNNVEEINNFVFKLQDTIENISKENPYVSTIMGFFNAKNSRRWVEVNDKTGLLLCELFDNLNFN